jgi:tetratricopeptide (TPR) repeat protein
MLTSKIKSVVIHSFLKFFTLLLFFSQITSYNLSYAGPKEDVAEDYRVKGYEEHQKGNFDEALKFYTKATSLGSLNPSVYNDMGVLYEQMGFDKRAEKFYLQALKVNKDYLPAYSNLAYFYKRLGETQKAAQYFRTRIELGDPNEAWTQKAREELLAISPQYREELIQIEAKKFEAELAQKAREEFEQKIALSAEHYKKGQEHFAAKEYNKAIVEFNESLSITPENPEALRARRQAQMEISKQNMQTHYEKAMSMMEAGNTASAKYELQRMLSTIPNVSPTNNQP